MENLRKKNEVYFYQMSKKERRQFRNNCDVYPGGFRKYMREYNNFTLPIFIGGFFFWEV